VWREFDSSKSTESTKQKLEFPIQSDSKNTIPVHFQSHSTEEVVKKGTANKGMNASAINWTVDFNLGEKTIENAVLTDDLPQGLTIDTSTIEVRKLDVLLNGTVKETNVVLDPATDYTANATTDGFEISFKNDLKDAYRVTYETQITGTNETTYTNSVKVTGKGQTLPLGSAGVPVKYSKPIEKVMADDGYNSNSQSITWEIRFNYNEQRIDENDASIKDTYNIADYPLVNEKDGFEVFKMEIDDDGEASTVGSKLVRGTDYEVELKSDGFELSFNYDVSNAYRIRYTTKSEKRVYGEVSVHNKVEMFDGKHDDETVGMDQVIFHKNNGTVNFKDKTIDWSMNLNDDEKPMDHIVIKDSFGANQGLTLVEGSVKIGGLAEGSNKDFSVDPNPDSNEGFMITFHTPIMGKLVITYTTRFDSTIPNIDKIKQYKNTATLTWDDDEKTDNSIEDTGYAETDNYTTDNGKKTGEYDAITKEITWTIDFNYNNNVINHPVIRDSYTGEQTFDIEQLKVYHLNIKGGSNDVESGDPIPKSEYDVDYTKINGEINGFELKFNHPISSAYRIIYKTSLKNHPVVAEYINDASLRDGANNTETLFKQTATVKPKDGGKYIIKTGKQGVGADVDFATWKVEINNSQSHVDAGAKLTDDLSTNQILVQNSFVLYKTKVDSKGNLSKSDIVDEEDYELDVKGNTFTLTFKKPLERAFILEYKSFINANHGESVTNKAQFEGHSSVIVDKTENKQIYVNFSGAGGTGTIPKGNLAVIKVDADDTNTLLPGAKFGLFDTTGKTLIQTVETDGTGKAVFENIKYKEYLLRELSAPKGYLFDREYKDGKKVTLSSQDQEITIENTKGVWDFELTKVDKDTGKVLEGAHFKLQLKNDDGVYEDVSEYADEVTLFDGTISYKNLVKGGEYQVIETVAPRGYKLNSTPYLFKIDENQSMTKKHKVENEINVGLVELLKFDEITKKAIAGVVFKLMDFAGVLIQSGLVTDEDGKIVVSDLKAGKYQFVEDTAHPDYVLDQTPVDFEIVDDGVTVNVEKSNKQIPGSVKLTKVENGRPSIKLEGAKFNLLDELNNIVVDSNGSKLEGLITDQNGEIVVTDLRPGIYYFEETLAPRGYTIQTKLTEFEVVKDEETLVTIENKRYVPGGGGGWVPPVDPKPTPEPEPTPSPEPSPEPTPSPEPSPTPDPGTSPKPGPEPKVEKEKTKVDKPIDKKTDVPKGGKARVGEDPNHGTVEVKPDGKWKYTPDKGYKGKDSFTIIVTDKDGNEEEVLVEIDIDGVPRDGVNAEADGKTLPKTGEDSHLPIQIAGAGLVMLGAFFLVRRKALRK